MTFRILTSTLAAVTAGLSLAALPAPALAEEAGAIDTTNADRQAALVAAEDRRLTEVRAVAAVAPTRGANWSNPYRLNTSAGYTLVLTQRREPYTVTDLLKLAPQTFTRQSDGSYLLTENIYLNSGAKLRLSNPGGLTLRLASNTNGFVSIVSFGGSLTIDGTPQAPTTITSWDRRTTRPDTDVNDGRAYLRAIGGQFSMTYTKVSDLGFWSGRTGGVSLTGTDRPDTGDVVGPTHLTKTERHEAKDQRLSEDRSATAAPGAGDVFAQPSGALNIPDTRFDVPGLSYVSGDIDHSTITGNAFGMFISSANGITLSDTSITKSLYDGLLLHRFASSAVVERVVSSDNGGDGIVLSRAAQEVRVSASTTERNGGNGFTVDGLPLATGASASGEYVGSYGNNSIANSVSRDNHHYGVEVIGGLNISVENNEVTGNDMGIVARAGADHVTISGNRVTGPNRQGVALRDGVTKATVTGNIIAKADTAIYIRGSSGDVQGNTINEATHHGIALVGATGGSKVSYNVVAGVGPSAVDLSRVEGKIKSEHNQIGAWHDTSAFWVRFRHYASPMTLLWAGILLLIIISAVLGLRRRRAEGISSPYANSRTLQELSGKQNAATGGPGETTVRLVGAGR
ncbi:right-handed parallel beta-helix repeat-containing protein [Actinoplanes siamensis]|uniref:Right handed beta helix domain-containing protein n=1 Tax=Actinoplanes siamensis TaxID=1223317 RepID=A0A919N8J8_9ACTN|nr:right-handed parallel beta-helix repeat-containing protein [Actinoplanes siamensis]GIF06287.1 hypothetical protein Asi03nite_38250 [Actinoplanes siamensis]